MTRRDATGESGASPRNESPIDNEEVRRQLAQLFGESLFGPWPQLQHSPGKSRQRRRSKHWIWGPFGLVTLVAAAYGARVWVKPGLEHHVDDQSEHYARELNTFIKDGNLERASQFVVLVEGPPGNAPKRDIDPKNAHLDLIVTVEAALYRYFDASPERLRRISPYLDDTGRVSPARQIAGLTILSREERSVRLGAIEGLRNDLPDSNELEYLLATALEFRNDARLSREAWERSAKLEPAWLGHRFEQAWFELHQDRAPAAQQIASQMVRVDPDSAWSKLAISTFALPRSIVTGSVRGDAAAPVATPVEIYFELLAQGFVAARRKDLSQAMVRLADAASAIQYQAPFLLDAFDWCIAEGQPVLAQELANMQGWPQNSKIATSKLERLSNLPSTRGKKSPHLRP